MKCNKCKEENDGEEIMSNNGYCNECAMEEYGVGVSLNE